MPRAFIAVLIPDELKAKAFDYEASLRDHLNDADSRLVKWVERDNLHVTLKFLGQVADEKVSDVCSKIEEAVADFSPFELEVGGAGAFPSKRRPSVVWIGARSGYEKLAELAGLVDDSLAQIGFKREQKAFHGHITVGRVRKGARAQPVAQALDASELGTLGSFRVDSVSVMESDLRPRGPMYSVLRRIDLE